MKKGAARQKTEIIGTLVSCSEPALDETRSGSDKSFSEITFNFKVTPELLVRGIVWAAVIGLIGGLFPGIRAARLPIASALREL